VKLAQVRAGLGTCSIDVARGVYRVELSHNGAGPWVGRGHTIDHAIESAVLAAPDELSELLRPLIDTARDLLREGVTQWR